MFTFPNQKVIQCIPEKRNDGEAYGSLSRKAETIAAHLLNDKTASHIIFLHLALNKSDYKFALSRQELENTLEISEKQYHTAIAKLEKAGYLEQSKPNSNLYYFRRIPKDYENITFLDMNFTENTEVYPPTEQGVYTHEDTHCTPKGIDTVPLEVDRNNTNITDSTYIDTMVAERNNIDCIDSFATSDLPEKEATDTPPIYDNNERLQEAHNTSVAYQQKQAYKRMLTNAQWQNQVDGVKISAILHKYLSTHKEDEVLKKWGDKYGRFIQGWNAERQEPIIAYSASYLLPQQMKHNIQEIPVEYYYSKNNNTEGN